MIGMIAMVLTSFSAVPQIIKICITGSAKDISIIQSIVLLLGLLCWFAYGIQIQDVYIIVSNLFSITLQTMIISAKLIYENEEYKRFRRPK